MNSHNLHETKAPDLDVACWFEEFLHAEWLCRHIRAVALKVVDDEETFLGLQELE